MGVVLERLMLTGNEIYTKENDEEFYVTWPNKMYDFTQMVIAYLFYFCFSTRHEWSTLINSALFYMS